MLRINSVSDPAYYLSASGEWDRTGAWGGNLAARLGIEGTADTQAFRRLMANRTPDGPKLTARDHAERRAGYDLTFSEPKSVSILRELAGDARIDRAREESIREVMLEVVQPLAATRERKLFGFHPVETGSLAWLDFHHRLGRPIDGVPDMNGHTHVVLPNATASRGRHLALEVRPIKDAAPLIQAAWHASYAAKLRGLGYEIRPTKDAFEIAGVHESTIKKFSRRSEIIDLEAKSREIRSPKGKAALGALTREKKRAALDPDALHAAWLGRLTPNEKDAIAGAFRRATERTPAVEAPDHARHLRDALAWHLRAEKAVPEGKLLETALRRGVGEATLGGLRDAMGGLVRARVGGIDYLTTKEAQADVAELVTLAGKGAVKVLRKKKGDPSPEPKEGRVVVPDAERLGFDRVLTLAREAEARREELLLVAGYRDYRKPARGEPLVVLEDVAGLKTGQARSEAKLTARVKRMGRQVRERVRQRLEQMMRAARVEAEHQEQDVHGQRERANLRGIGY